MNGSFSIYPLGYLTSSSCIRFIHKTGFNERPATIISSSSSYSREASTTKIREVPICSLFCLQFNQVIKSKSIERRMWSILAIYHLLAMRSFGSSRWPTMTIWPVLLLQVKAVHSLFSYWIWAAEQNWRSRKSTSLWFAAIFDVWIGSCHSLPPKPPPCFKCLPMTCVHY